MASTGIRIKGEKFVHHIPRALQSTLFRLITGHAFTGAYRLKFKRPNLPPATEEEIACACGAVPEDTEHVLLHCPLTRHHRRRHLFTKGPIDSLRKVFDHPLRCLGLLRFLEATRVCVKPRTTWEPGWGDRKENTHWEIPRNSGLSTPTGSSPAHTPNKHAPPHTPAITQPKPTLSRAQPARAYYTYLDCNTAR
ncbi:hypothetical protein V8E52_004675 [Russula decolorans]|jgi:hypothetical protein